MNWQNIIGILFWVGVLVLVCIGIYGIYADPTPWFWVYWIAIIALIIAVFLLRHQLEWIEDMIAIYHAQMCENNNWWCGTIVVLAIHFTIVALLAGGGEPRFMSSYHEFMKDRQEWVQSDEGQKEINTQRYGTRYTDSDQYLKDQQKRKDDLEKNPPKSPEEYSSWFWTKLAGWMWFFAIISYPVTRRDEVAHAIREGIKRAREKHNQRFGSEETGGSGSHEGGHHGIMDFAKIAVPFEILIELVEILFHKIFQKIKPLAQKALNEFKGV